MTAMRTPYSLKYNEADYVTKSKGFADFCGFIERKISKEGSISNTPSSVHLPSFALPNPFGFDVARSLSVDWLTCSYYLSYCAVFREKLNYLENCQFDAIYNKVEFANVLVFGMNFKLLPFGKRVGGYKFILVSEAGFQILLMREARENTPPLAFNFTGAFFSTYNLYHAKQVIGAVIYEILGIRKNSNSSVQNSFHDLQISNKPLIQGIVQRLDISFDVISPYLFNCNLISPRSQTKSSPYVTALKDSADKFYYSTVSCGSHSKQSNFMCRVYDKVLQSISEKKMLLFKQLYPKIDYLKLNSEFKTIYRVEVELHRKFFMRYDLFTIEQLNENILSQMFNDVIDTINLRIANQSTRWDTSPVHPLWDWLRNIHTRSNYELKKNFDTELKPKKHLNEQTRTNVVMANGNLTSALRNVLSSIAPIEELTAETLENVFFALLNINKDLIVEKILKPERKLSRDEFIQLDEFVSMQASEIVSEQYIGKKNNKELKDLLNGKYGTAEYDGK